MIIFNYWEIWQCELRIMCILSVDVISDWYGFFHLESIKPHFKQNFCVKWLDLIKFNKSITNLYYSLFSTMGNNIVIHEFSLLISDLCRFPLTASWIFSFLRTSFIFNFHSEKLLSVNYSILNLVIMVLNCITLFYREL